MRSPEANHSLEESHTQDTRVLPPAADVETARPVAGAHAAAPGQDESRSRSFSTE